MHPLTPRARQCNDETAVLDNFLAIAGCGLVRLMTALHG
jgi:hypothetical protein